MLKLPSLRLLSKERAAARPTPKYFSLIDLGTDTVKVAVVEVQAEQVAVLGHSLTSAQGYNIAGGRAQGAKLADVVNSALQDAEDATEALAGRKIVPDHALFLLPDPDQSGKLFTVTQRRDNRRQPVTQAELDALWERALRLTRQGLFELPKVGADWLPQTVTFAGLWLDGRLVNDPPGMFGRELTLSVYGTICPPAIVRALEKLAERLELEIYRLIPASQALAEIVPVKNALVLDVGAESSKCALIRRGALTAVGVAPLGGNFFNRAMCRSFKCRFDDAESLKVAYTSQALSELDNSLVRRSLHRPLKEWAAAMVEAIGQMLNAAGETQLPCRLYFVGGSAILPGLQDYLLDALKELDYTFKRAPEIAFLGEAPLPGYAHNPTDFRGILFAPVLSLAKTVDSRR